MTVTLGQDKFGPISHLGYNNPLWDTVMTRQNLPAKKTQIADSRSALCLLFKNLHLLEVCYINIAPCLVQIQRIVEILRHFLEAI